MLKTLLDLFLVFAPLSIVTIGGGQSAIPAIHHQVVEIHQWMTQTEFVDMYAISRMTPGPGSLFATLIGWHVAGAAGAIVATLSLFGPTAFLIYGVAHLWGRYRGARWQIALETGLRPVAAGMILSAGYVLFQALDGGWVPRCIAIASTVALSLTKVNPLAVIAAGAIALLAWSGISLT